MVYQRKKYRRISRRIMRIMKEWYHYAAVAFAAAVVTMGLCMDFDQSYIMGGRQKVLIYATPIFVLFVDMIYQMEMAEDDGLRKNVKRCSYFFMFMIYMFAAATLLFFGSSFRRGFERRNIWKAEPFTKEHFKMYCNLKPLRTISMYIRACRSHVISVRLIVANLLGNLVVFMPCALFFPVLWEKRQKKWRFFLPTMLMMVTAVECIQFLTMVGQADIDDVILNVSGACIAFALRPLLLRSDKLRMWF